MHLWPALHSGSQWGSLLRYTDILASREGLAVPLEAYHLLKTYFVSIICSE